MADVVPKKAGRPGRPKGSLDQGSTAAARRSIAQLLGTSLPRMQKWLDDIANGIPSTTRDGDVIYNIDGSVAWLVPPSPLNAWKCVADCLTFALPRLQNVSVDLASESFQSLLVHVVGQASPETIKRGQQELLAAHTESEIAVVLAGWANEKTIEGEVIVTPPDAPPVPQEAPTGGDHTSQEIPAWLA